VKTDDKNRRWRDRNKDRVRAWKRASYARNAEKIKARRAEPERSARIAAAAKVYAKKNREAIAARRKLEYLLTAEKQKAATRAWYKKNRERAIAAAIARNARKDRVTENARQRARWKSDPNVRMRDSVYHHARRQLKHKGTLTVAQWREVWESYGGLCVYCAGKANSMEHITPFKLGGKHEQDNVVPACRPCNGSKNKRPLLIFLFKRGIKATPMLAIKAKAA
jgi:5-methylcytosine-specific restriction endonuclease McrA